MKKSEIIAQTNDLVKLIKDASRDLNGLWHEHHDLIDTFLTEDYPFAIDFKELALDISTWQKSVRSYSTTSKNYAEEAIEYFKDLGIKAEDVSYHNDQTGSILVHYNQKQLHVYLPNAHENDPNEPFFNTYTILYVDQVQIDGPLFFSLDDLHSHITEKY